MKHPTPDQLAGFHDGIVSAATLVAVEEHLNECAECHEALALLDRQDRALATALTHDPGDAHFEALAERIEGSIEETVLREKAMRGVPAVFGADAARAASAWRGRLVDLFAALRRQRVPEWGGAAAALIVAVGLVFINLKQAPGPALRDRSLEQRAGQAADGPLEAEGARERAPRAAKGTRDAAREDARGKAPQPARAQKRATPKAQPPGATTAPGTPTPSALATRKQALASRAHEVKRTPSGEDVRVRKPEGVFAKPPPEPRATAAPGGQTSAAKPRRAAPLDDTRARTEGEAPPPAPAKGSGRAAARNEASSAADEKSPAPQPSAALTEVGKLQALSEPTQESVVSQTSVAPPPAPGPGAGSEPPTLRLCGDVKDALGRPIPSASVTLVTLGRGVSTDAEGKFCIEAPPGEHTLSVIAMGYAPLHRDVSIAPESPALALTLHAVPVLEEGGSRIGSQKRSALVFGGVPQTGSPGEALGIPDSLQPVAGRAVRLTLAAERSKSAPHFESAAAEWERVRERSTGGPLEIEARFRLAEARFHAWELGPNAKRAAAANEALTSYLVRAPLGPQRDRASAWLGRVK